MATAVLRPDSRLPNSHHQSPFRGMRGVAFGAHASNDERPPAGAELVFPRDRLKSFVQFFVLELDDPSALFADEMVVEWIAVVVVEDRPGTEFDPPEETGINEFGERTVDGGATDAFACLPQFLDELFGVEV